MVYSLIETIYIQFDFKSTFKLLCLNYILERTFSKDFTLISRKLLCLLSSKLTSLPLLHLFKTRTCRCAKANNRPRRKGTQSDCTYLSFRKMSSHKKDNFAALCLGLWYFHLCNVGIWRAGSHYCCDTVKKMGCSQPSYCAKPCCVSGTRRRTTDWKELLSYYAEIEVFSCV